MRWLYLLFSMFYLTACGTTINPEAAAINAQLGLAYLAQQEPILAKEKLLLAIAENPNDSMVNDAFAYFWEQSGEMQRAEHYYLLAIKVAIVKGEAWNNYAAYLYRQQRYREALRYFLLAAQDIKYLHAARAYKSAKSCVLKLNA